MPIFLDISESFHAQVESELIGRAVQATLDHQAIPAHTGISVAISDDERIRALNDQFRGIDSATDVLAFPAEFKDPESEAPYLGDVLISFPRARAQAQVSGHAVEQELQLLAVHGVLHLLGYDHAEPDEKKAMWQVQAEVLNQLGIGHITLPE